MASSGLLAPEMNDSDNSGSFRDAFTAIVGFFLIFTANALAQEAAVPGVAEVERVIVDRFEYSDSGRDRAQSSGHLSAGRPRKIGHSQRTGP